MPDTTTHTGERRSPDTALAASIGAMLGSFADQPDKLRAVVNGLALDGSLRRAGLPAGLAPLMRLPGPEPVRQLRARMADLILRRVSATGSITRDELLGGGFTEREIADHFHGALRAAGVAALAV